MTIRKHLSIPCFFISLLLCISAAFSTQAKAMSNALLLYDGEIQSPSALLIDSASYIPLRYFCEQLYNCDVSWNAHTQKATVQSNNLSFDMSEDMNYITVNGRYFYSKGKIFIQNGTLYVSSRLLAKIFSMPVNWDQAKHAVVLEKSSGILQSGDDFYNSNDLYWLSRIIYSESGAEPLDGQIAVGNVVLNRVKSENYPDNIHDVIFDQNYGVQFEPVANGSINCEPSEQSLIAAKICLEGDSTAANSIYFLNEAIAKSKWIVQNRSFVMKIGNHSFYF